MRHAFAAHITHVCGHVSRCVHVRPIQCWAYRGGAPTVASAVGWDGASDEMRHADYGDVNGYSNAYVSRDDGCDGYGYDGDGDDVDCYTCDDDDYDYGDDCYVGGDYC